ncbi:MAG: DUF7010 family protein [Gemmatirosa sp.]
MTTLTLDQQHAAFLRSRFLAMPIAGTIAWAVIGAAGAVLPLRQAVWALFIGTGSIFYLGLAIARLTGEDLLGRESRGNFFDRIFILTVVQAVLVYALAIPFFLVEPTSLPLSVGVLTGLMWIPFSALAQHWVGLFHGIVRTVLVVVAWYLFPAHRFVAVPAVIVAVYLVTIAVLARRAARLGVGAPAPASATVRA